MRGPSSLLVHLWSRPARAAFLLALAIRFLLAAALGPPAPVADDQQVFLGLRDVLLAHGTFADPVTLRPTGFRDPGYPAFLALLARSFGTSLLPVVVVQALLGALTSAAIVALAQRAGGAAVGRDALVLTALSLPFAALPTTLYSENLALPLLALAALLATAPGESAGTRGAIAAGLAAGALSIVRWALAPVALVGLALASGARPRRALAAVAVALALPLAWSARNLDRVGLFTPNTNGIYNAYLGSHARTPAAHPYRAMYDSLVHAGLPEADEATRARAATNATIASWREAPGRNLLLGVAKVKDALGPDPLLVRLLERGQYPQAIPGARALLALVVGAGLLVSIAGVAGALACRDRAAQLGAAALVVSLLTQALTLGHPRFTGPLWLLLVPGAATLILRVRTGDARSRWALAIAAIGMVAIAVFQVLDLAARGGAAP